MNAIASTSEDDKNLDMALGVGGDDWILFKGSTAEVLEWLKTNEANSVWSHKNRTYMSVPVYITRMSQLPHAS